ncbi:MAG: murein biosynthesis integral membrane protein MurJ [Clostridiales bacterium]|nr:murein biosynthesis integral membrane protein MurJ [Clostridiales bacterium]
MKRQKSLVGQGLFLSFVAIMASILSFAKEAIFANYFGVSEIADAYTVAIQVPEILFAVVWESINAVVIPLYTEKLHNEGKKGANRFISNFFSIVGLICILFVALGEIFTAAVVKVTSPGLSDTAHALAVDLMRWVLPVLIFEGVIRVATGVLNVHKQFVVPKILTTVRNIGVIVFLVAFSSRFGVFAAAFGFLCGIAIECVLCYLTMLKNERFSLYVNFKDPFLIKAGRMAVPLIIGIGINELNQIADKIIASFLIAGSISSLNYASKLSSIIHGLLLSNVITIMYPTFSRLAAEGDREKLTETFVKTVRIAIMLCVPIIFGGIFLRQEIVSIAFMRGAFDQASVDQVSVLFSYYLATTFFVTVNSIGVKVFTSCYDTKTPAVISSIGVVINIALNIVLAIYLGVVGLVIATLISSAIVTIACLIVVHKKIYKYKITPIFSALGQSVLCGVLMMVVLILIKTIVFTGVDVSSVLMKIVYSLVAVVCGVIVYGVSLIVFRAEETNAIRSRIARILHRKKR